MANCLLLNADCPSLLIDLQFSAREKSKAIIAHMHEWNASAGIVLCRKRKIDVTFIFTTHATLLGKRRSSLVACCATIITVLSLTANALTCVGRYLCAGSVDFYNSVSTVDVDYESGRRGIFHRVSLERSAAHCADVFTTVSHITAFEAEHLLKRKPGKHRFTIHQGGTSPALMFSNLHDA